jgi:indole-3-glycerol phosphate synthase
MSILAQILAHKRSEIAALDRNALRRAAEGSPAPRDFVDALDQRRAGGSLALIAELKRASPSKGVLAAHLDLPQVAEIYATTGAAAISVLTDAKFFQGSLDTLHDLRSGMSIGLPLLRKDFIIDESQLYEARAAGADAVLLIAAALPDDAHLAEMHALALALGMAALVEVHDRSEVERALRLDGLRLVGINNRSLDTFEVSLSATERLRPEIPPGIRVVSESGIFAADDVVRLARAGVDAVLVGEALVTAQDIAAKVRELSGVSLPAGEGRPA